MKKKTKKKGFLGKMGRVLGLFDRKKTKENMAFSHKKNIKTKLKIKMIRHKIAKPKIVKHVRVYAKATIRKEILMPEPWSRVEKYKKVKKEGAYGYHY